MSKEINKVNDLTMLIITAHPPPPPTSPRVAEAIYLLTPLTYPLPLAVHSGRDGRAFHRKFIR